MKKGILLLSCALLFITVALANAPPVTLDYPDVNVEFVADDNNDFTVYAFESIQLDQVALPLMFDVRSYPAVTITVNPGTLSVNYLESPCLIATQDIMVCQLKLCTKEESLYSSYLFNLNTGKTTDLVAGPSRLDIGEFGYSV